MNISYPTLDIMTSNLPIMTLQKDEDGLVTAAPCAGTRPQTFSSPSAARRWLTSDHKAGDLQKCVFKSQHNIIYIVKWAS